MSDLTQFIETANRVAVSRKITTRDAQVLQDHASWAQKFKDDRAKASAARSQFGPQRKPDSEVKADTLRRRAARDRQRA